MNGILLRIIIEVSASEHHTCNVPATEWWGISELITESRFSSNYWCLGQRPKRVAGACINYNIGFYKII